MLKTLLDSAICSQHAILTQLQKVADMRMLGGINAVNSFTHPFDGQCSLHKSQSCTMIGFKQAHCAAGPGKLPLPQT